MHILCVSQMYPGPTDPDLGVFVAQQVEALAERGHRVELAVLDHRAGGKRRYLELRRSVHRAARPDVVWAHFLVPAGLLASSVDAPLVVTAHGRDVRNIGTVPGVAALTRRVVERASAVVVVSEYLRRELELRVPEASAKMTVINSGVNLDLFMLKNDRTGASVERPPAFLAVGTLSERKNVVRLADAFAQLGRGSLTFVGDGPLRSILASREGVRVTGSVAHDAVPGYLREADVLCAPALIEPFGQAILEAMATGTTVVATRYGGPPEFVSPAAGLLVDPLDVDALAAALDASTTFPRPNEAARDAAAPHDVRRQAERLEAVLLQAAQGPQV